MFFLSKKLLIIIFYCLLTFSAGNTYAQFKNFKVGFKGAFAYAFNRTDSKTQTLKFDSDGQTPKMIVGIITDIQFANNYAFSTGILFATKQCSFSQKGGITSTTGVLPSVSGAESWGLQYLQIPMTVKMFTRDIFYNCKVYVQAGPQLEFLINKSVKSSTFASQKTIANPPPIPNEYIVEPELMSSFNAIDLSLTASGGLEYSIGDSILFGGINFQTGSFNTINKTNTVYKSLGGNIDFSSKNMLVSIEIGIKL
jgi:hypothetical protein